MASGDSYQYGSVDDDPVVSVTLPDGARRVRVINMSGAQKIGFTTNGATPSLTGNNRVIPASVGASVTADMEGGTDVVKLISAAGATDYGVWVVA